MVFVVVHFLKFDEWVMFSNFRQPDVEVGKNSLVEDCFPVLGDNNNVIVTSIDAMAKVY
jgi:hypothetical protein